MFGDVFLEYLGCGSVDHLFRPCLDKVSRDMKQKIIKITTKYSQPKITFATPAIPSTSNTNLLSTNTNP